MAWLRCAAALLSVLLAGPLRAQPAADLVAPEPATAPLPEAGARKPVVAANWMVAAANPLAAEAGAEILRKGGSAADAAVAVQLVLGLVEPQSSGLGGGAFALYFDAGAKKLTTLDGRETAPGAATPKLFLDDNGAPLRFYDAVVGGRSVGVPGTPRLLEALHARFGTLGWRDLFGRAIDLAENGFPVSRRLLALVSEDTERLSRFPATRDYFISGLMRALGYDEGLKNPAYAETLKAIRDGGADAFYSGPIASDIVAAVRGAEGNPGVLALRDLAGYEVKEREPVCGPFRLYLVCGMGPPSSGGVAVAQILGLLAPTPIASLGPDDVRSWQLFGDATRLAFADRERYLADSDFVPVPVKGLLDPDYVAGRAALLQPGRRLEKAEPGEPAWDHALRWGDGEAIELPSTSQIVIVDAKGDVLSMTTTIENQFGSRLMVRGFLLNNELTDFSFRTQAGGRPVANRVEPGKRPRSSMAPTIVLKDGAPVLAIGSPGGSQIIPYVAEALIAVLDWGLDVQSAVDLPHLANRFGAFDLEAGTAAERFAPALRGLGYEVKAGELNSGLQAIEIAPGRLQGAADSRREGVAIGE
ncbi:gamma-glutamyltransferase [Propylenella binzhouense]|uniref:Glutathione hydrolase proenzyme n=1 Tax=Propylenella binzhouense TaxID=2555902 RepID=A0A964T8J3_9HYPH|nr:gamma-glutamyltransferase [Propylenella binzhouense]MYZ50035.1 gamma-glutamyltransferase [Propylenella binzhouense]